MALRVVGTGLPRTGTASLQRALAHLLGGACYHMSEILGHPFELGRWWDLALTGRPEDVNWAEVFEGYVAAVDWPTAAFWRQICAAYPEAVIVHSHREDARTWWESMDETVLKVARMSRAPDWGEGRDLIRLLEGLTGTTEWDDPDVLQRAYLAHGESVQQELGPDRVVNWAPEDGWEPLCRALGLPVPDEPFPHTNRRQDWG